LAVLGTSSSQIRGLSEHLGLSALSGLGDATQPAQSPTERCRPERRKLAAPAGAGAIWRSRCNAARPAVAVLRLGLRRGPATRHPARLQAAVIPLCIRPVSRRCRQHNRLPTRPVTHNQRHRLSRWLPLFQMPHPPRRRQAPLQRRRRNPRRRPILCRQIRQIRQIRQLHQISRHQRPPKTRPRSTLQSLSSRCCRSACR
jgi:hypothetical protein